MARAARTLERMRANPRDRRIEEVEAVAHGCGLSSRRGKGSHTVFLAPGKSGRLAVPARKPIRPE